MQAQKKISKRLVAMFIIVVLISSIAGLVLMVEQNVISNDYAAAMEDYGFSQGYVSRAMMKLTDTRSFLRDMISAADDAAIASQEEKLAGARSVLNENFELAAATATTPDEKALVDEIRSEITAFFAKQDEIVAQLKAADPADRGGMRPGINAVIDPMYDAIFAKLDTLLTAKAEGGQVSLSAINRTSNIVSNICAWIIIIAIVCAIIFSVKAARSVSRPIEKLVHAAKELESGNLDYELDVQSEDEI